MLFGTRMVQIWSNTGQFFWSEDGIREGSEHRDDGNTVNGDWSIEPDGKTSNNKYLILYWYWICYCFSKLNISKL